METRARRRNGLFLPPAGPDVKRGMRTSQKPIFARQPPTATNHTAVLSCQTVSPTNLRNFVETGSHFRMAKSRSLEVCQCRSQHELLVRKLSYGQVECAGSLRELPIRYDRKVSACVVRNKPYGSPNGLLCMAQGQRSGIDSVIWSWSWSHRRPDSAA